jgi:polyhydroxyalkanoate synthesis repressor PhaR
MPDNAENHPKQIEIRKYPNRRYYDVTRSKHLTLEDIRSLVREGSDIRVTDSKTSANITAKVLAQIILELDSQKIDMFPVALLMRLIRANDQMAKDFLERYFDQALSMFLEYRKQFSEQFHGGEGLGAIYSSLANWNRAMLNPFAMPFMGLPGPNPGPSSGGAPAEKAAPDVEGKVRDLEQQIANLEAKLARPAKRPKSKSRRKTA